MLATSFLDKLIKSDKEISNIYYHLFSILGEKALQESLDWVFDVFTGVATYAHKDDWFFTFHKSIRQTDFFGGCTKETVNSILNEEEYIEYKDLSAFFKLEWSKACSTFTEEERLATTVYRYSKEKFPVKWERRCALKAKDENRDVKSINGHLDSLLWTMIHMDTEGVLYEIMETIFKEYQEKMDKIKI